MIGALLLKRKGASAPAPTITPSHTQTYTHTIAHSTLPLQENKFRSSRAPFSKKLIVLEIDANIAVQDMLPTCRRNQYITINI